MNLEELKAYVLKQEKIEISKEQMDKVSEAYTFLTNFSKDKVIYGINTGFGPMAQFRISDEKLNALQYNLVRSHANGAGLRLPDEYVKAVMISRLNTFLLGFSGVSEGVVLTLQSFINN